ncbi:hypothetical protein N656DRAFT_801692 [Canariomyces notabilis]|uniref:Protein kinase domain-containing protein n=1 Tax=Canariomyces notabilis TaxID=2074819 RepID=A0AAN6QF91_9PEZI|nr:hypothetical protein N656DRAFT_801692 [Canariomyces arenarius]
MATSEHVRQPSILEDYHVGQVMSLRVLPNKDFNIRVRIRKLPISQTFSCGMVVSVVHENEPETTAFLKLFDRRFAHMLRYNLSIPPWTKVREESYMGRIQSSALDRFLHPTDVGHIENHGDYDPAESEILLAEELLKMYKLDVDLNPPDADGDHDMFHVKGILLEYIEGFPLSEMRQHATELEWLEIVQKANGIIQTMGGHDVLHGDPRSQNFIVSRMEREDGTKELRVFYRPRDR